MKILVTGAHFTPAVAVIEELQKMEPKAEIVYVGRKTTLEGDKTVSVESQVLPSMRVKFIPLTTGRLQRNFSFLSLVSLLKIPVGFLQSGFILFSEKPDVILSFGGYVAVPIVILGWLGSIPIIVHEQTLVSGLANKMSGALADKIALSFKEHPSFKKDKVVLTGNPLRKNILTAPKTTAGRKIPNILITGGNQGSHIINKTVEQALNKLTKFARIYHISGDNKFGDFERLQKLQNKNYIVKKWVSEEWGLILSETDLVVCRAGINTLLELSYLGKPALVIPLPYLINDEQSKNAHFFQNLGLARILPQGSLTPKTLLLNIKDMLKDIDNLKKKALSAKSIVIPDASRKLALETLLLAQNNLITK